MRFQAEPVRIDDERGVVVGAVIGPHPGRAVVAPAGAQRRRMERIDRRTAGGGEQKCSPDCESAGTGWATPLTQNAGDAAP